MSFVGDIRCCPDCGVDYEVWEVNVRGVMYLGMRCKKCTNTPEEQLFWGFRFIFAGENVK